MKLPQLLLFRILFCYVLGILSYPFWEFPFKVLVSCQGILLLGCILFKKRKLLFWVCTLVFFWTLGIGMQFANDDSQKNNYYQEYLSTDAFYVMDLTEANSSVNTAVGDADGIDTNYAAVYYPWVKVLDTAANKPVLVPPSVIVPGAIAASDSIAAEWFAPAGLNRGVLGNVIEAKTRLNQAERDILYDSKINPIATFPATGVCIWGQKTLQTRPTALDRINVRRLLIAVKKFIASSSRYFKSSSGMLSIAP